MNLAEINTMSIAEIIQIIYDETGIDAHSIGQSAYDSAISKRMSEVDYEQLDEYLAYVRSSHNELTKLIEEIIVPETWFFRDNAAFDALVKHALNNRRNNDPLRVLSLPSSSGEEAYSAAIALREAGFSPEQFMIDGIDISQKNIISATSGIYRENSFRNNMPKQVQQKYFKKTNHIYQIDHTLQQSINFIKGNLFDNDTLSTPCHYDVIFCKNLFIYFNAEKKEISFNKISNALRKNGLLLIGHSESGIIPNNSFTPCDISRSFGFLKKERPVVVKRKTANKRKPASPAFSAPKVINPKPANKVNQVKVEQPKKNEHSLSDALSSANSGDLEKALEICKKIDLKMQDSDYFTLLATIHGAQGDIDIAETHYRKALFLDPRHIESLTHLALLLNQKGDITEAERLKQRLKRINKK